MIKRIKTAILFSFISIFLIFLFQFPICAQESTTQNACYYKLPDDYRLPFVGLTSFSTNSWLHIGSDEFAIDFPLTYGQWIFASNKGAVIFAGDSSYGNLVKIKHPDGLISYYAHLSKIFVKVGDYVLQGYPIGEVGNTGKYSTGTHLHFHVEDELDNPIYLLDSLPGMPNSESPTYSCPLPGYAIGPPLDVTFCTLPSYIIAAASSSMGEVLGVAEVSKVAILPPSKPSLTSPYNWYQSLETPPMLMWSGDNNSTYYYVVANSSNTGNVESGWIKSNSWKPNLPNQNYIYTWKVKAKNSQGVEGPWSDESHFSIASTALRFEGDISFSPQSPSSADIIKIFASTTGWGGVGITLRVSVNTAGDGSANGEWKILKELGVPKFNENDAPEWHTKEWQNGTYRIKVEAKGLGDPYWQNPAVIEATYTITGKSGIPEEVIEEIVEGPYTVCSPFILPVDYKYLETAGVSKAKGVCTSTYFYLDSGAEIKAVISGKITSMAHNHKPFKDSPAFENFFLENDNGIFCSYLLSGKSLIEEGDEVSQGQVIAISSGGMLGFHLGNLQIFIDQILNDNYDRKCLDLLE